MSKIVLILGAGPRLGSYLAKSFSSKGYKVATASRTPPKVDDGADLHITVDLTQPETVPGVFEKVRKELGGEVGVVIYNAGPFSLDPKPDPLSLFSPSNISQYHTSQNVNGTSVLVSMYEAVQAFRNAPADASKTFIFTGNILNLKNLPGMLNFGLGKSGPAYAIRHLAETGIYKGEGIKFYYADERTAAGDAVFSDISGPAAGEVYLQIVEFKEQGPWLYTYVKGEGYQDFEAAKL